jgi:HK97 family phage major capsid protein
MTLYSMGQTRSFYAGEPKRISINTGKTRLMSEADQALYDAIIHGKSYTEEVSMQDLKLIEEKALAGFGTQVDGWQPETLGGQIIDMVRQKSKVRSYHQVIATPSDPYELPVNTGNFTAKIVGEGEGPGISKVPQGQIKFNHKKIMIETETSTEFEEDSVPQMMAFLRNLLATNLAEAEEDLLFVNHATDGMLKNALDKTSAFASDFTPADVLKLLQMMPTPYNLDPSNLVLYMNPTLYWRLVESGDVRTVDAFGSNATIITGELGKYYGMSVAPLQSLKADASTNKLPFLIVNRASLLIGQRRTVNIRVFPDHEDKNKIEATIRTAVAYPHGNNGLILAKFS